MGYDLNRLRNLPLEYILESFGSYRDPKDPSRNWRTSAGRITVTGSKFYNHDKDEGGGGAIDLVMHLAMIDYKEAVSWLQRIVKDEIIEQYDLPLRKDKKGEKLGIPAPVGKNLYRVRRYLKHVRAIPERIIEEKINSNDIWADEYGNAVFSLKNLRGEQVGAEIRGTCAMPFHGIRGNKNGFFFAGTWQRKEAVFVESAIDALSYEALHGPALILSTTGTVKYTLQDACKELKEKGFRIVAGFDNDKDGERLTKVLSEAAGDKIERRRPEDVKDWNALLKENNQRIE